LETGHLKKFDQFQPYIKAKSINRRTNLVNGELCIDRSTTLCLVHIWTKQ